PVLNGHLRLLVLFPVGEPRAQGGAVPDGDPAGRDVPVSGEAVVGLRQDELPAADLGDRGGAVEVARDGEAVLVGEVGGVVDLIRVGVHADGGGAGHRDGAGVHVDAGGAVQGPLGWVDAGAGDGQFVADVEGAGAAGLRVGGDVDVEPEG